MKAIRDVEKYLQTHPNTPSARVLARVQGAVSREGSLDLGELYALDWESFELAIELLRDWRIDRYYANRTDLFPPKPARREADLIAE